LDLDFLGDFYTFDSKVTKVISSLFG